MDKEFLDKIQNLLDNHDFEDLADAVNRMNAEEYQQYKTLLQLGILAARKVI
jgi:hypothetical protein